MVVTCNSFGVSGMDGYKVELEASMYNGTREFDMLVCPTPPCVRARTGFSVH